jgi:hypothetical protein
MKRSLITSFVVNCSTVLFSVKGKTFDIRIIIFLTILSGCIEPYDPALKDGDMNYVVVDAFLNASDGTATARLSYSQPVKSSGPVPRVLDASVSIDEENGGSYPLSMGAPGVYSATIPGVSVGKRYRLVIKTHDSHEYVSEFTSVINAPPIDSITWSVHRDGIRIEITSHDETGSTKYFKWNYTETYEYKSRLHSQFMFSNGIVIRRPDDELISTCWRTDPSSQISIGTVKHLQQSVLSKHPLTLIPYGSRKLYVKYSILVQQQGLTEENYNYWLNLEKSTENLGGLFDPLPSEIHGNIRCVNHAGENALGLFSASTVTEMRKYISRNDLPVDLRGEFVDKTYCEVDTVLLSELPNLLETTLFIDAVYEASPFPVGYTTAFPSCGDCRYWGGQPIRPLFWE